jgi:sulfur carrier protein ThiS adenylyltransferase
MQIRLNEKNTEVEPGTGLFDLIRQHKPDADVIIWNGFPVSQDRPLSAGDRVVLIKRGEVPSQDELEALLVARHTPGIHARLKASCVGIAGLGGLGSVVAASLARVGIGKLILVDFDVVEPSNLNRQQYFVDQIGQYKADATQANLARTNPFVEVVAHRVQVKPDNVVELFGETDVIVEAFDLAERKVMLAESVLTQMPGKPLVVGSGLAGYGRNNWIQTRQEGNLYICGDEVSEARPGRGLMAPRVGIAANHQANQVLEILLGEPEDELSDRK